MTFCSRFSSLACIALLGFLPCTSIAQYWEARAVLTNVSSPSVNLTSKKDGEVRTVATVRREWVQRLVVVTERLAPVYGMQPPQIFISGQAGLNASVSLKDGRPVMFMTTDMLRLVGDDDDLVASVTGHELGHLKADHLTNGAARAGIVSLLGALAGAAVDINRAKHGVDTHGAGIALGQLGGNLVNAKFSRDQEREADAIGLRNMASAGFDPNAVPRMWQLMESKGGGGGGLWTDSHPSHAERLRSMQALASVTSVNESARVAAATTLRPTLGNPFPPTAKPTIGLLPSEQRAEVAGVYRQAYEAFRAERTDVALSGFVDAAEKDNDERALFMLGEFYRVGKGVEKDSAKAHEYYTRSASLGFPPSIFMLGDAAQFGLGRPVDTKEAARLFAIAESRGMSRASARLSLLYITGTGVDKNPVIAREMAQRSADRGDALGRAVLGALLRDGVGGPADPAKAFELLSNIGDPKIGYAHYQLALAYEKGIGVQADKEKAAESYRRALSAGVASAKQRLQALGYTE